MVFPRFWKCLKSKEFELPYQLAVKIDQDICRQLNRDTYKYEVQSKVSDEVFQIFLQYLVDGTEPKIHLDTIYELKQLAQEFQIVKLLQKITDKFNRWQELEKILENESPNTTQLIEQLNQVLKYQMHQIEELQRTVNSLKADCKGEIDVLRNQITDECETLKIVNQSKEDDFNKTIKDFKDKIINIDDQLQEQNAKSQNNCNLIDALRNQIELINNQVENQKTGLQELEENSNVVLEQIQQTCANKLSISGNKINLENRNGVVLSSIPSLIDQYSFKPDNGHIKLTNNLLIQWGRYKPSNWAGTSVRINFPIQFAKIPFIATAGGRGGDYNPAAISVTAKSFITGYDNGQPTTWIAFGTV